MVLCVVELYDSDYDIVDGEGIRVFLMEGELVLDVDVVDIYDDAGIVVCLLV